MRAVKTFKTAKKELIKTAHPEKGAKWEKGKKSLGGGAC